jgi:hypothetical protein
MEEFPNSICIVIASHISNPKRIKYLIECLDSLTNQTVPISIYLSISIENELLKEELLSILKTKNAEYNKLILRIRDVKTQQMRHIYLLLPELLQKHKWVMFCDDDDTYDTTRVEKIMKNMYMGDYECNAIHNKKLAGLYESTFGKDHREHRHEYWCYCVNVEVLKTFYNKIENYPDIIDNKCCDVLFAEHLRRLTPDQYLFCRLEEKLYNYRVEDNSDSITGFIKGNQHKYTRLNNPPSIMDPTFSEYVVDWNEYLYENIEIYIHDVFLRTIVGCDLDYILRAEFRADYQLLTFVDNCHVIKIKERHEYWRGICNNLFDIPFS